VQGFIGRIFATRGRPQRARQELRYRRLNGWPPLAHYRLFRLAVIHATERSEPANRLRIEGKPVTDLPGNSRVDAIERIDLYAMRWKRCFTRI